MNSQQSNDSVLITLCLLSMTKGNISADQRVVLTNESVGGEL